MKRSLCTLGLVVALTVSMSGGYAAAPATKPAPKAPVKTEAKAAPDKTKGIIDTSYKEIQSLSLLTDPPKWVDQKVSFEGTFNSFHPYALDYKGAMREAKNYISFLIQRPDVTHHVIPMSELKLVYPRDKAESVMDLESGDKILVKGKVFSAALGDPWVDVDEIVILKKNPDSKLKDKKKSKHHGVDE